MFAHKPLKPVAHFQNEGIQIERNRHGNLLAAERQQLARDHSRPLGRLADEIDLCAHRMIGCDSFLEKLTAPQDHRQQVVEVVSHAAGKLSNDLVLPGLHQFLYELFPVADVAGDALDSNWFPVVVNHPTADFNEYLSSVSGPEADFVNGSRHIAVQFPLHHAGGKVYVFRNDEIREWPADDIGKIVAADRQARTVDVG